LKFSEYIKKIESETPNRVNWLFGQGKKLMDDITDRLVSRISFQEKQVLFGGELEIEPFIRSLFETDLFAASRLYIIRDCHEIAWTDAATKSFTRWLQNPTGESNLIFTGNGRKDFPATVKKQISKTADLFELKPLYENEIRDYIKNLAVQHQKIVNSQTIQMIIELCGTDLQEIHSQWDKLMLYLGDTQEIRQQDVEEVIGLTSHFNVFQLIDNMMAGHYLKAIKIIHSLLEAGIHPLQPMSMIIRHFSQLEQLMLAADDPTRLQELKVALKIWDFQYKKFMAQIRRLSLAQVEIILDVLGEIDTELKSRGTSSAHAGVIFEKGMLKIFANLKQVVK